MYRRVPASVLALSIAAPSALTSSSRLPGWAGILARTATLPPDASLMAGDRNGRDRTLEAQSVAELADEVVDRHPDLLGGVPIADRDRLVLERLEVDGDRERRADLVLAAVAATDRLRLVVVDHVALTEGLADLVGERGQRVPARQREHGHLVRRDAGVEAQHRAVLAADHVLVVGRQEERSHRARRAGRRLDDVRGVARARHLVEVVEALTRAGCVGLEVEVRALGDPLELVEAPREQE